MQLVKVMVYMRFVCILLFSLFYGCSVLLADALSVSAFKNGITTDKIKIHSAYCLNSEWHFTVYDGIANKTFSLMLNKANTRGFKIFAFDEQTQTADIQTPYGVFKIGMFESGEKSKRKTINTVAAKASQEAKAEVEADAIRSGATQKVISRRSILSRIK